MADLALFEFTRKSDTAVSSFWELRNRRVNALGGDDSIKGSNGGIYFGIGALLLAGSGADSLDAIRSLDALYTVPSFSNWGVIKTESGNDSVQALGTAGIKNLGRIITGKGKDEILGRADSSHPREMVEEPYGGKGIYNRGRIITGDGADRITGESSIYTGISNDSKGLIKTGPRGDRINGLGYWSGISNGGVLSTGAGDDAIIGTGGIYSGVSNDGCVNTGTGNDVIIGVAGDHAGITNSKSGVVNSGAGNDVVNAISGGFVNYGKILLGSGKDTLIGFTSEEDKGAGRFSGGRGRDKLRLGDGVYQLEGGRIALLGDGRTMKTNSFEKIGGVNGGLFNFADGRLTITAGVATSLV